ncbi:hypothetical protein E2320_013215, partial [Naja naja]
MSATKNKVGSDVEAVAPDSDSISGHEELASEEFLSPMQEEDQQRQAATLQVDFGQGDGAPVSTTSQPSMEPSKLVPGDEKEKLLDETSCVGAVSDDSDIVTLEVPKVEEVGSQEEAASGEEEGQASENFNMGSSSSSQYTFCQPETAGWLEQLWTVVLRWPSGEESSSDETSHGSSPALRRRRAKKRLLSSSESEEGLPPHDLEVKQPKHPLSSGLNRCIILALVIAVSMGFGHFYGLKRRVLGTPVFHIRVVGSSQALPLMGYPFREENVEIHWQNPSPEFVRKALLQRKTLRNRSLSSSDVAFCVAEKSFYSGLEVENINTYHQKNADIHLLLSLGKFE